MVRWFAPQLLGIPVDLQMVRVSKEVPPFFDNIFRPEDFQSDNFIISDPFIMRAKPLLRGFAEMGPNDLLGFRNRSIPNIADIITIGDSQTYGNNVYMEQNWPSSLAAVMDDNLPTLYNMSVGGWGAAEYFEIFNKALHFEPKVVVIAFYTGNDPLDTFMKVYGDVRWKSLRLDPKLKASDTPVVPEYNIWEITFEEIHDQAVAMHGYLHVRSLFTDQTDDLQPRFHIDLVKRFRAEKRHLFGTVVVARKFEDIDVLSSST